MKQFFMGWFLYCESHYDFFVTFKQEDVFLFKKVIFFMKVKTMGPDSPLTDQGIPINFFIHRYN